MLYYGRPKSWLRLVFTVRGSALVRIRFRLLAVGTISLILTFLHEIGHIHTPLTLQALSLMGLALGIFLGFRNNTSYDRFWEGRRLWGTLVNVARTLTRDLLTVLPANADGAPSETVRRQVYRVLAFVHALRMSLRDQLNVDELSPYLGAADLDLVRRHTNAPNAIGCEGIAALVRCVSMYLSANSSQCGLSRSPTFSASACASSTFQPSRSTRLIIQNAPTRIAAVQ